MSKASTASLPKQTSTPNATPSSSTPGPSGTGSSRPVSAWSKGPPLAARSSSASPAPAPPAITTTTTTTTNANNATPTPVAHASTSTPGPSAPASGAVTPVTTTTGGGHGRKGSVAMKDGVSVGRGAGGSLGQKAGAGMSFGSISDARPSSPSRSSPKTRTLSKPPSPSPAPLASDVKAFGSIPATHQPAPPPPTKKDEPSAAAAEHKKALKKKIDVNALFQAVPQPHHLPSASPSPSKTTAPSLPSTSATSPAPPSTPASTASNAPVTGRQPNGAPANIYNGVPMRNGPQGPQQGPMQMMGSPVRYPVQAGRGGPPNGVGRGQQGPQQQGQQQQQGPPGSPRGPPGPQGMMSPLGAMNFPPGVGVPPGSPWVPYYVPGLPYPYDPSQPPPHPQHQHPQHQPQPGQPSPYPTYWQPGMPPGPHMGPPPPHMQGFPPQQGQGQGMMMHQHPGQQQQGPQGQGQQFVPQQHMQHLQPPPPGQGGQHPLSPPMRPQGMPPPPTPGSQQQQQQHQQQNQGTPLHLASHLPPHAHPHLLSGPPTPAPLTPQSGRPLNLPPTPGTPAFRFPLPSTPGASQLNTAAREFVPSSARGTSKIKLARPDGTPLDFSHIRVGSVTGSSGGQTPVLALSPLKEEPGAKEPVVVGTVRKPVVVRMESEADKAKREKEEEERVRKEKEEEERKVREEEERVRKEKEEEERKVREEEERVKREKEEEENRVREAEERVRKEKEAEVERVKKEEEERVRKEKEAEEAAALALAAAAAAAKAKAEEDARLKAAEDERRRAEEERKVMLARLAEEEDAARKVKEKALEAEAEEEAKLKKTAEEAAEKSDTLSALPSALPSTSHTPTSPSTPEMAAAKLADPGPKTRRPVPGPLDLKSALAAAKTNPALPSAQATALLSAKPIEDISSIQYPAGIRTPDATLNAPGGVPGKFRYDREFLMQFMNICKDKPETLPPLDAIGLDPGEGGAAAFSAGGGGRTPVGGPGGRRPVPQRGGLGLGITGPGTAFAGKPGFSMGNFQAPVRATTEDGRRSVSSFVGIPGAGGVQRPLGIQRTASASGLSSSVTATPGSPGGGSGRIRSQRGKPRTEGRQPPPQQQQQQQQMMMGSMFEPVTALQPTANRWVPQAALGRNDRVPQDSPEVVERKVKALLNKLTLEKFDSISDQIISFANRSEHESDGHTLILVIKLVFEKATDEPAWSEMYARLCRKMMERISPNVYDVQVKNAEDQLIVGGQLFRKYLLNRCQEDFERGWAHRRTLAAGQSSVEIQTDFSEEYYAAQRAKRRGLGLVRLIGELFKLQMLTERIMHECIKKMLANVETPEEEEIESLCKLLATVGQALDTVKAKAHMDIYFARMKEMANNPKVQSRMRYMLQDTIELRERGWRDRKEKGPQGPMTIAQIHQAALREDAQKETARQNHTSMSRGGSRRGDTRGDYSVGPDGWQNVQGGPPQRPPPPAKVGDLSHFGKINKTTGPIGNFGPSTAFAKKDGAAKAGARGEPAAPAQARTGNMFNLLGSGGDAGTEAEGPPVVKGPSRKPSVDLGSGGAGAAGADAGSQRKKLKLLPRSVPLPGPDESAPTSATDAPAEAEIPEMSDEKAQAKIDEDVKEFWQVRDVAEAADYFRDLPASQHDKLVDRFVSEAFNKKDADVALVADIFSRAAAAGSVSADALKKGLAPTVEFLDDVAVDVPQAYAFMAKLVKGAGLGEKDAEELAGKIAVEGDPLVLPKDKLMKEFAKLA